MISSTSFKPTNLSLADRVWLRIERRQPHECWPWIGGQTTGGRRNTPYGIVNEGTMDGGSHKQCWRAHQVVLLLRPDSVAQVAADEGEEFIVWLRRARRYFTQHLELEAAHQCDNSLCCNPNHLEWESRAQNLFEQRDRERRRREEPGWVPRCMEAETYIPPRHEMDVNLREMAERG